MFVVGLTGGIGSGKSAASSHFSTLGIDIIDADIAARTVVEPEKPALLAIAEHFGQAILLSDGNLNRAALRQKIFSNNDEKLWLESLLHPLIAEEIQCKLQSATSGYAIFVSPLMMETNQQKLCNRLLVIDVPEQLQLERTLARDNSDPEQVARIIASQASREQRLAQADDIIENTAGIAELEAQVDTLHQLYLSLAAKQAT